MAKNRLTLILILLVVIFNNCATTTLIRTKSEYTPVSPKKARFKSDLNIPADRISPNVEIKVSTELLNQKVKFDYYKKDYSSGKCLGCLSINSIAIPLILVGAGTSILKTWEFWIGALMANVVIVKGLDELWMDKVIEKKQIIEQDTCYQNETPFANQSVKIGSVLGSERITSVTDKDGRIKVDIRELYGTTASGSVLELEISQAEPSTIIPTKVEIPASYVQNVKNYEHEAEKIFLRAQENEIKKRYEQALRDYNQIVTQYPESKSASASKTKVIALQDKIKEEKINEITKKLLMVSESKVQNAIIKLGLDEAQSNALAIAIENLSSATAARVMKDGLGMPLSDNECSVEYRKLTLYQKFYAVNCYLRKCDKDLDSAYQASEEISEVDYWYQIANDLNISEEILYRLLNIKPESLLKK